MPPKRRQSERPMKTPAGRFITDTRVAWVTTESIEAIVYQNPEAEDASENIVLLLRKLNMKWAVDLTHLTTPELDALEAIFARAFKLARPLVVERDRQAKDEHEAGIGTQPRLYRRLPVAVGIEGHEREYVEGLRFRPPTVSSSVGDGDDSGVGIRGNSDAVDSADSREDSAEDDAS